MLSQLPQSHNPDLLSQSMPFADAAIYRIGERQALVQSVDFFTPLVDDPYQYGQIAAANALSDLYAVGAQPLTALNLVSFPVNCLEPDVLLKILQGGAERVHAAGAVIGGGHSIEDDEPKYGLSVTGMVDPARMLSAAGCRPGDQLYLTKPLGTGLLTTALKGEMLCAAEISEAVSGMVSLNQDAAAAMLAAGASASTDITGFGLVGHAVEMAEASQVGMRIFLERLPVYPRALEMADMGLVPAGSHRNRNYYFPRVDGTEQRDPLLLDLFSDAQTSGGLLIAVSAKLAEMLEAELHKRNLPQYRIGEVTDEPAGRIVLA